MALRSIWKGTIRFSLVSVPVQAYTASESDDGKIRLNQLHAECHSRIRYKKTCPIHGEVSNDEIVSGYEYAKDQYVIVDPEEVDKLRTQSDRSISIDTFIEPDQIDPIYYDGRTYYLAPEGAGAVKPYAVLCRAMEKMNRYGVATIVLHGREELVLVRPLEHVITMTMLHYESQVREPSAVKEDVPATEVNNQELKLAQQLIDASTADKFDFSKYEDRYTVRLRELIELKVAGKEVVAPPQEEEAPIINLMDALKKSVARAKKPEKKATPGKRMAASKPRTAAAARRRKTS